MASPEIIWDNWEDPSQNDAPLEFDSTKGQPPITADGYVMNNSGDQPTAGRGRFYTGNTRSSWNRDRGSNISSERPGLLGSAPRPAVNTGFNQMMTGMAGNQQASGMFPSYNDNNMYNMPPQQQQLQQQQLGNLMGALLGLQPALKEILRFNETVLYPPSDKAPPPTTRMRPPGCRTVFVGGVPEKITEDMLRDIFGKCGEIESIRLSKKKFCHIRFVSIDSVDRALVLSGYRIRINDSSEDDMSGKIHVDFAEARNDQYEYDCYIRSMELERKFQEQVVREQRNVLQPASPSSSHAYSEYEASRVLERLRDTNLWLFSDAAAILVSWLEHGECTKHSAGKFYNLVQVVHAHIRRVQGEKIRLVQELDQMKLTVREQIGHISSHFDQIGKVFSAVTKQKAWDHFSKAQRKSIEMWHKQAQEAKAYHDSETMSQREEDEMEVSDEEGEPESKRSKVAGGATTTTSSSMTPEELVAASMEYRKKMEQSQGGGASGGGGVEMSPDEGEDVESLRSQLQAKERQVASLQQALQGMIRQNMAPAVSRGMASGMEMQKLRDELNVTRQQLHKYQYECGVLRRSGTSSRDVARASQDYQQSSRKTRLIALISTFLLIHPNGANIDYICSYLSSFYPDIRSREIEDVLMECSGIFHDRLVGVGATLGRRWVYSGLVEPGYQPDEARHITDGGIIDEDEEEERRDADSDGDSKPGRETDTDNQEKSGDDDLQKKGADESKGKGDEKDTKTGDKKTAGGEVNKDGKQDKKDNDEKKDKDDTKDDGKQDNKDNDETKDKDDMKDKDVKQGKDDQEKKDKVSEKRKSPRAKERLVV